MTVDYKMRSSVTHSRSSVGSAVVSGVLDSPGRATAGVAQGQVVKKSMQYDLTPHPQPLTTLGAKLKVAVCGATEVG